MKQFFFIISLLISFTAFSQEDEYYRVVDWQFYPDSVVQLSDSTYKLQAVPFDWNEPGAANRIIGNYVADFVGRRFKVIDSTSTTITVYDFRHTGQAPQTGQVARCYRSVGNGEAEFIGSVDYSPLDESAKWKLNGADNEIIWRSFMRYTYIGIINEPTITKNIDGTITIDSDGDYIFNEQENGKGRNIRFDNVTGTTLNVTDNSVSYVYVDYNGGNPFYAFESENLLFFSDATLLPVVRITRLGTQLHFEEPGEFGVQLANKILYKNVAVNTFQRQSGLTLSTAATRISTISSGIAWFAIKYYSLTSNVAGSSGVLYQYYLSGGNWLSSSVTSYDADYYSDGTNRQTLSNNKWVAKYFYRDVGDDNEAYYIHGNQYNTQAEALAETLPFAPNIITAHSIYVGKIVIQKGSTNGTAYPRQWEGAIQSATSSNHADLTNLGWTVSNHTSESNKIAAFDATGAATTLDTITNLASQYDLTTGLAAKVTGAASSTDNAIARFDGNNGKLIQNSGVTISDANAIVTPSTIQATTAILTNITNGNIPYKSASGFVNSPLSTDGTSTGITNAAFRPFVFNRTGTSNTSHAFRFLNDAIGFDMLGTGNGSNANFSIRSLNVTPSITVKSESLFGINWTTGNILIGTATDNLTDKLQVNGSILATTAKFTNLTDNFFSIHQSDAAGLINSNVFQTSNKLRYNTTLTTFDNDNDIPNVWFVNQIASGNMPKLPVDAATTGNIALSGTQTIDGYTAGVGARILVWKQTTASQNGVYIVASGSWTRATDLDTWAELYKAYVTVLNGAQSGSSFVCTIASTGTLGTDAITWILYNAPTNITVSSPLAKSGNNISLGYDTNTLDVASNNLKVKDNVFQAKTTALTNTTAAYKTADSTKLAGIAAGAEVNVNADWTSVSGDAQILNKPTLLSQFTNDLGFLTTETDPIFAADSAKILHWSDTLNTTKGIASQYDLTTGLATKQNTLTTGNLTENVTGLQFDATRQVIGGSAQLSLTSGYIIPTTTEQSNWNTAYTDRLKWDGGATGLVAATGRTSLGGTTIGQSVFTSTNPSAITFLRANADNTVSWLDASAFRTAIGAGTGGGSVTSVAMTVPTGLTVTGSPITTSGTLALSLTSGYSIPTTANQTNWTAGYNDKVNSLAFSGTTTKTLTLTQQDGGSVSNTFTDLDVQTLSKDSVNITNGKRYGLSISSGNRITITDMDTYTGSSWASTTNNSTNWNTAYTSRISSLTTTGSSGAATLISNVLNIPNYTLTGLGGVPTSRTLTINGTTQDLSANRTYNVGTVTSVATGLGLSGGTIATTGTIVLDTASTVVLSRQRAVNTYQPKGTYQTGTESYISNLSLSGNTLTSTGVGSAFNSTVGNIANTTYANVYNQSQTVTSTSSANGFRVQDAGSLLISSVGTDYGLFYMRDGNPYFVNGDFGSSEINLTPSPMIYPSAGIAVSTGSAWGTSITDNSANWNTSYNDKVNSLSVTGTTTKTITLTQQDGGTVTGNFTDNDTYTSLVSNGGLGASGGSLYLSNLNATGTAPLLTDYMWAAPSSSTTVKSFTLQTLKDLIGTSSYTLPLAANGTRGGIQIGYTSTANNFALQLSSEKAYTALPDATTLVKGIASFSSGNFSVSSGAVSVATGGIGAMNLANAIIAGQVDIGADIVDTDEFLISDAGTLRRTDASRLKTYIGAGFADPMTTIGDIIFRNSSNVTTRLPIGTGDYVLKSYMGTPSWQPLISGTTSGAIPFNNGSGSLNNDGAAFTYNTSTNTLDADVVTVDTEVYDATGWDGDLSVPTKDAVRDKIETMQTSYDTYYDNNSIVLNAGVNNYINIFTSPASTANTIYAIVDIHVDYGNNTYTHSSGNFSSYFNGVSIVKQNWVESYHDFLTTDVSIIPEIVDNGTSSTFRIKLNSSVGSTYHYVVSVKFLHKL